MIRSGAGANIGAIIRTSEGESKVLLTTLGKMPY
jgi:hypothetical protein